MKKRIGIITIEQVNNYGAELQAMATQKVLQLMGYDAEIIDYCYYKNWDFKDSGMSAPFVPMGFKGKLMYWLKYRFVSFLMAKFLPLFNHNVKKRVERFCMFHKENTKMGKRYVSMKDLYKDNPDYDVYMVGSDQVWNPSASSSIEPYFLTFAPKSAPKISYASSFGVSKIDTNLQNRYKELLSNIDHISVREQSGVDLVKSLTGRDAHLVLDPTLLINSAEWPVHAKEYTGMPDKYILVYQLLPSDKLPLLAKKLTEESGCPVYYLAKRAFGIKAAEGMNVILDAGPSEFVWLIANASCVITNSFHGIAFSVNFGKPFYAVLNKNRGGNARITSLLSQVGLDDRIVYEDEELPIYTEFDNDNVQKSLERLREASKMFLRKAIS